MLEKCLRSSASEIEILLSKPKKIMTRIIRDEGIVREIDLEVLFEDPGVKFCVFVAAEALVISAKFKKNSTIKCCMVTVIDIAGPA